MNDAKVGEWGSINMNQITERHDRLRGIYKTMIGNPCKKPVEVGSRVLLNAALVDRGHEWILLEAKVVEISDTGYLVEFKEPIARGMVDRLWVKKALIVDVLGPEIAINIESDGVFKQAGSVDNITVEQVVEKPKAL